MFNSSNQSTVQQREIIGKAKECLAEELTEYVVEIIEGFKKGNDLVKRYVFHNLDCELYNPFQYSFLPRHYFFFDVFDDRASASRLLDKYYRVYIDNGIFIPKVDRGEFWEGERCINQFPSEVPRMVASRLKSNGYLVTIATEMKYRQGFYIAMNPADIGIFY